MAAGEPREKRRRSVGGMVVHNNNVEGEIGPLRQRAVHRIATVRTRFRTGMTTLASRGNGSVADGTSRNSGRARPRSA